jgi:hypothetical protein
LSTVSKAAQKAHSSTGSKTPGIYFIPSDLALMKHIHFSRKYPCMKSRYTLQDTNWWKNKTNSLKLAVNIGTKPPSFLGSDAFWILTHRFLLEMRN